MEKEIWSQVVGYEGLYEISTFGRVKRLSRFITDSLGRNILLKERFLVTQISKVTGYPYVNLSKDGNTKSLNIHKLIADAFIPNPLNLPCINHIDEIRSNSVLSNLERCDYSYNNSYGSARDKRKETLRKNMEGRHKNIYQYSKNGELIAVHTCGVSQLEERLGYCIGDCLNGKSKTAHGYYFSYCKSFDYKENLPLKHQKYVLKIGDNDEIIERYKSVSEASRKNGFDRHLLSKKLVDGIAIVNGVKYIVEVKEDGFIPKGHKGPRPDLKGKCAKAISQYTKEGVFIRDFDSANSASLFLGKNAGDITKCCKGTLKSAHGYLWTYKGESAPKKFIAENKRPIEQYTLDGLFLRRYNSIKDAIMSLGRGVSTCIGNNLSGRTHSSYGYIWKYAKD